MCATAAILEGQDNKLNNFITDINYFIYALSLINLIKTHVLLLILLINASTFHELALVTSNIIDLFQIHICVT